MLKKDGMMHKVMQSETGIIVMAETKNFHMITRGCGMEKADID